MGEPDDAFDVPGDRSPRELADHLGWPHDLVAQLVEQGHIVRTESGWRVDVAAELRRRRRCSLWPFERWFLVATHAGAVG